MEFGRRYTIWVGAEPSIPTRTEGDSLPGVSSTGSEHSVVEDGPGGRREVLLTASAWWTCGAPPHGSAAEPLNDSLLKLANDVVLKQT